MRDAPRSRSGRPAGEALGPAPGTGPRRDLLDEWLGEIGRARFLRESAGRQPVAQAGSAQRDVPALGWDMLARVLAAEDPPPDVLVVARGALLPLSPPRTLEALRGYLARGIGLCVRDAERCDPVLAEVAAAFAPLGRTWVQLFVTPGGTWGFGWHFDEEHVFIVQTAGVKDYRFRANTVTRDPAGVAAFRRVAEEGSPLFAATLVPGDFLYLPSRWWHRAQCREEALSVSIGVRVGDPPGESPLS